MLRFWGKIDGMDWLNRLPPAIKFAFLVGGALMSAFSNQFPNSVQEIGFWLGIIISAIGLVALIWHFMTTELLTWTFQWPLVRRANMPVSSAPDIRSIAHDLYVGE